MIDRQGIERRVTRLDELMQGVGRELARWKGKSSPLSDVEKKTYLNGVLDTIKGLDDARVVMAAGRRAGGLRRRAQAA